MCGITGFVNISRSFNYNHRDILLKMSDTLNHRGPDDSGIWLDKEKGVGLGHRRLAILDLSSEGHQPMVSHCGRYVMVYNGEIYNFRDLRQQLELKGYIFSGHSDTEVMLAAFCHWGLDEAVGHFVGMFAFALWDRSDKKLYLVRDRMGIKPLYYGWMGSSFLFGSELKSLKVHPAFNAEIDRDVLAVYLRNNYIPAPYSIYKGISKLTPGCILTLQVDSGSYNQSIKSYWSVKDVVDKCIANPVDYTDFEAVNQLETLLREAVGIRMVADVPLGAFLSGGIDSSMVVAIMQSQSSRPVNTFTIGFNEEYYNEARHARAVSDVLGTDHTEIYLTSEETMAVIPKMPFMYDEPFADTSQIPTFLVCELARRKVTVSLSGDGGDEIFGGYNHYFWTSNIWKWVKWIPHRMRRLLSDILQSRSPIEWNRLFELFNPVLPRRSSNTLSGERIHKLAEVLPAVCPEEIYRVIVSIWRQPGDLIMGGNEPDTVITKRSSWPEISDLISRIMFLDMVSFLPDDILVKVDRASMGVSLEARVPLLDHRIVEFSWGLPISMKIRNGQGKWILRQILYKYVPREMIERPKMGFGVPIEHWLRGPLRGWANELLSAENLKAGGFFRPEPILKVWHEHISGQRNWQHCLWNILMFQAWLQKEKVT